MDAAKTPSRDKTLLIVEDAVLTAVALKDGLEDAGYTVMELTDHYEAAASAARKAKPDMALVNIKLNGKDDGIVLAREFKALGIPVLFISGQSEKARAPETGAWGSLPKPYNAADMVLAVDYLLACQAGDGSLPRPADLEVFESAPTGLLPDAA